MTKLKLKATFVILHKENILLKAWILQGEAAFDLLKHFGNYDRKWWNWAGGQSRID